MLIQLKTNKNVWVARSISDQVRNLKVFAFIQLKAPEGLSLWNYSSNSALHLLNAHKYNWVKTGEGAALLTVKPRLFLLQTTPCPRSALFQLPEMETKRIYHK